MRFPTSSFAWVVTTVLLLVSSVTGAKSSSSSTDRFTEWHTKQLSAGGPIKLADATYRPLVKPPRDYSVAVLLNALDPRLNCRMCIEFSPEWSVLARSWVKGDKKGESRLVLATLDFADGKETFSSLGLQTAPVLLLFPPTEGEHAVASKDPIRYDFTTGAFHAEQVQAWLSRHLPGRPHPEVKRPFNWMLLGVVTVLGLGIVTVVATMWSYIAPLVQSKNVWAAITLTAILVFTSGHMFNHIRGVPYVAGNGRGGIQYIAPSFQSQYGLETQIIAGIYGVLAFCTIALASRVPHIETPRYQAMAIVAYSVVIFVAYGFLLKIFRMKNPGYPLSLPPFV